MQGPGRQCNGIACLQFMLHVAKVKDNGSLPNEGESVRWNRVKLTAAAAARFQVYQDRVDRYGSIGQSQCFNSRFGPFTHDCGTFRRANKQFGLHLWLRKEIS